MPFVAHSCWPAALASKHVTAMLPYHAACLTAERQCYVTLLYNMRMRMHSRNVDDRHCGSIHFPLQPMICLIVDARSANPHPVATPKKIYFEQNHAHGMPCWLENKASRTVGLATVSCRCGDEFRSFCKTKERAAPTHE
jgi:hypothetical protein